MIPRSYRIHIVLMIAAAAMIIIPLVSEKPDPQKASKAKAAAEEFLDLVDQGQYQESWQVAAAPLREKVSLEEWVRHLEKARVRSGGLVERRQDDIAFSTMAKDSPEGEYIVLKYESRFEAGGQLEETITVMLDQNGNWRVAGYFMQ